MSLPSIVAVISLGINLLLGALVIFANPQRSTNRQFLFLSALGSLWLVALALSFASVDASTFLFWLRSATVLGAFVPLGFRFVRLAMLDDRVPWRAVLRQSRRQFVVVLLLALFGCTSYHVKDVAFPVDGIPNTINGDLKWVYPLGFLLLTLHEVWLLLQGIRETRGVQRFELNFLCVGAGFLIVLGAIPALVVPLIAEHSQGVVFAPLWIVMMDTVIAYGIATRRIMNVSAVMRRVISWTLLALYLVVSYVGIFYLVTHVTGHGSWRQVSSLHSIIPAVFVVLTFGWVQGRLDVFVNRAFTSGDQRDPMKDWVGLQRALTTVTTTSRVLEQFSDALSRLAGTDRTEIRLQTSKEPLSNLERRLLKERKPLLVSALRRQRGDGEISVVLEEMASDHWELALGIYRNESLMGVVYLAERLSGRIYSQDDLRFLEFMVQQLSRSLENAMLYTDVANRELHNKTLLNSLISGVIASDENGDVTMTNPEARRILSISEDDSDEAVVLPEVLAQLLGEILMTGEARHNVEMDIQLVGNPCRSLRVGGAMLSNKDGESIGALLVVHDISAERQLEKHIRHSDRLATIGKVSASVAHEIKNPLVAIKAFAQLLPERKTDEVFLAQFSDLVDSEVERIDTAIGGLLNYARMDSAEFVNVSIHEEIKSSVDLLSAEFRKKRLQIELHLEAPKDTIDGHAGQIKQLLVNLLLNANDAVEMKGMISISSCLLDEMGNRLYNGSAMAGRIVEVRIKDNGQGIADVDMNQVLMPFFTTKKGGTGLGLPLVASLVAQHGGTMGIESSLGEGTTITLRFPIKGTTKRVPVTPVAAF